MNHRQLHVSALFIALASVAVLLTSCEPDTSGFGISDPITSRWWFKPLVIGGILGGIALFRWIGENTRSGTSTPSTPQPNPRPTPRATPTQPPPPAAPPAAGTAIWFYRNQEQEFGPFTQDALVQLAAGGVVRPDTEIRRQDGNWVAHRDVFGG